MEKKGTAKKKQVKKTPESAKNRRMTKEEYTRLAKKNGWPLVKPDVD